MRYGVKALLGGIAFAAAATISTPALAVAPGTFLGGCTDTYTTPNAIACNGYYTSNVLSAADVSLQQSALQSIGYTGTVNWSALVSGGNVLSNLNGTATLNFGQMLSGITYIGAHFGAGSPLGNVSVFWKFDFLTPTDHITLSTGTGSSDAVLYSTGNSGVPEPATWAMMLVGFAGVGFAIRRKRREANQLLQLA